MNRDLLGTVVESADPRSQGQTIKLDTAHPSWGETMTLYGWDRAANVKAGDRVLLRYQTSSTFGRWKATRAVAPEQYSLTMYSDPYGPTFDTLDALLVWWAAKGTLTHPGIHIWNQNAVDEDSNGLTEDEQDIYDGVRSTGAIPCNLADREHAMVYEGPGEHGGSDYRCEVCGLWMESDRTAGNGR